MNMSNRKDQRFIVPHRSTEMFAGVKSSCVRDARQRDGTTMED